MILSEEQKNHYKRQIIIPEIGEQGQKKLLDSTVLVYCENTDSLRPLAYYLAAMGIGKIFCDLQDKIGADSLFAEVIDLNNDTKIDYLNEENYSGGFSEIYENNKNHPQNFCRIVLGNYSFIKNSAAKLLNDKYLPTIISANSQWKGTLQTFINEDLFKNFIALIADNNTKDFSPPFLANALSATLSSIECVKLCLNIGNITKDMLFFDLFNMEFKQTDNNANFFEFLNEANKMDIKQKLSDAKVLIVGVGGLGSPAAYGMAMADVNTLGLLDLDEVEMSNLNRQILHSFSRIGMPKASSAEFMLKKLNPSINIKTYKTELTRDNAEKIFLEYDLIIAAVDNIPSRYLINDICFLLNKPFAEAGVLRFDGTATTLVPKEGHCYRCLYPNVDSSNLSGNNGVLGSVPGVMGFIQAAEAVKILSGFGKTLKNKILLFDSLAMDFNIIDIEKNPRCPTCGK
ncbi:MAG TPA: ThiF family adenylyltransferase [Sedimentibacter sp.]|nr:ThiF family adenylyltransferase [Sedimentibacter sp.]